MKFNIAPALRRSGMTQAQLADQINKGKGYVSEIVSGKKHPSIDTLMEIIAALKMDPGELFTDLPFEPYPGRTTEEDLLLRAFRALPPERQAGWLDMANLIAADPDERTARTD